MQNTINSVAENYLQTELGREVVNEFFKLKQEKGWKFLQGFVIELGNHLANEVLSPKFQRLDDHRKLVRLEAYSELSVFLRFFANPISVFERVKKINQHNKRVGESPAEARRRRQAELTGRSLQHE